jgi:hypothetical protein
LIIWNGDLAQSCVALVYLPWDEGISEAEPWGANNVPQTWQEWDTMATTGYWYYYVQGDAAYSQMGTGTWSELLAAYGNFYLVDPPGTMYSGKDTVDFQGISIRVGAPLALYPDGSAWWKESASISGFTDMLTIGVNGADTSYDFEPVPLDTIDKVKKGSNGDYVELKGHVVTMAITDEFSAPQGFYIEEPDRSAGLRIVSTTTSVNVGDTVDIVGQVATKDLCERAVLATSVTVVSSGNPIPDPFTIDNIDTGGGAYGGQPGVANDATIAPPKMCVGLNNIGVLATLRGKVTAAVDTGNFAGYFYVDDAYSEAGGAFDTGLKDGTGNIGIKCRPPLGFLGAPGALPNVGDFVEVTGVIGIQQVNLINVRYFWTKECPAATTANYARNTVAAWNLLSLPAQPKEPDPALVFGSADNIDGRLYAWDAPTQSLLLFDMWSPDGFGPLSSSVGYWLNAASPVNVSFTGYTDVGKDKWISAPAGWKIAGVPFDHNTYWSEWKATDGSATKSLFDASQYGAGWLQSTGYWWDETTQSLVDFGLDDDWPTTNQLNKWHGYWMKTSKDIGLFAPVVSTAP